MTWCFLSSLQACWEPAETYGREDPFKIRCLSLLHPALFCQAKAPAPNQTFPPLAIPLPAPFQSKSQSLVPKYFAPPLLHPPGVSLCLPSFFPTHWLQRWQLQHRWWRPPLFRLLLWFFSQRQEWRETEETEETDCVSSWILSPASCAVIGLALRLFLFNFLHSPLNYNCQTQKNVGKNKIIVKNSVESQSWEKKKQHCIKDKKNNENLLLQTILSWTVILKYFKVDLFLFCTNGSFQLRNVYLKVLKECQRKHACLVVES